ncbi:hypothetical protein SAMN02745121_00354 [Nannocystis exedens]|uniref:Uncharacterized protein n=1 Tax=Nannocystis exedens TaxID=54 RepID=A0A1I1T726_9BACT|nr:choice-of-anchor L domain-containing protein [Nannocystis exedens]PCC66916.1 hypothetical protein NAEX_09514 [Nannocystis exedens]SFD51210.1 hypothetical protein SAMN02745121_00354 [Nannocystis exedens]
MLGFGGRWIRLGAWALLGAGCNGWDKVETGGDAETGDTVADTEWTGTQGDSGHVPGPTGGDSQSSSGGETEGSQPVTGGEATVAPTTDGETTGEVEGDDTDCPLAQNHLPCDADSDEPLHAIGLDCAALGGAWTASNAVPVANYAMHAAPELLGKRAWQVARSYGSFVDPDTAAPFWGAREGDKVLLISSGLLPPPDPNGAVIVDDGDVYNDVGFGDPWDSDAMPPPMQPAKGSAAPQGHVDCDGTNDCSNTIFDQWQSGGGDADDKMWFGFELTAPASANGQIADANGYRFDFAFFSAEFPEWVDTDYNDIFVVWQASESFTGNVVFIDGRPLTVTALWPVDFVGECDAFDPACDGQDEHLAGTGYIADGGATGWYRATGSVQPGETFSLTFAVFDMGDSFYDTTAILDNWAWDCEGCVLSELEGCDIAPQ